MKQLQRFSAIAAAVGMLFAGCDKATEPEVDSGILYEDAAESIAAGIGDQSGGVTENFADVMIAAGGGSVSETTPGPFGDDMINAGPPTYDPSTGWWSVSINRTFSSDLVQRSVTREYRYQFQKNGVPQATPVTAGGDTATTLKFVIVSGSGFFRNPRVSHTLTSLKGAWTSSNIHTGTVTITLDSQYVRSGVDSIKTRQMLRTHVSTLTLTSVNVQAKRYRPAAVTPWRNSFADSLTGTISGNYSATIAFQRGDAYKERSINRDFTITLNGGEGSLSIAGANFKMGLGNGQRK